MNKYLMSILFCINLATSIIPMQEDGPAIYLLTKQVNWAIKEIDEAKKKGDHKTAERLEALLDKAFERKKEKPQSKL